MSAQTTMPGANHQTPHDDETELSMSICLTPEYPLGIFPADTAVEGEVVGTKCSSGAQEECEDHHGDKAWRGLHRRLRGWTRRAWREGGPGAGEGKVETCDLSTGAGKTVDITDVKSLMTLDQKFNGKYVSKVYGPKKGVVDTGLTNVNTFAGADLVYTDKPTGMVCTGMPLLPTETFANLPHTQGILRLGYVLRTQAQLQGLLFLQIEDEHGGWVFKVFQAPLGHRTELNIMRDERFARLYPRSSTSRYGGQSSASLDAEELEKEKKSLEAFQYAFSEAMPVILQRTHENAGVSMGKIGLGGKLGTLKTHSLSRCVAKEVMTFTWSGKIENTPSFPSMEEAQAAATEGFKAALKLKKAKKAEAEKAEAKKAEAEKAERAKKVAKQADELKKAETKKALDRRRIDASPAASAPSPAASAPSPAVPDEARLQQAVLLREKELRLEMADADRRLQMQTVAELRAEMEKQKTVQLELTAREAMEQGRRQATEQFTGLLSRRDADHKSDLKEVFLGNNAIAKDAMGKQSAQIGLMFNMFSQFT
ncbi:hypothetical protein CYMTET_39315 [Cymbomonas tetramitiformis]|uniref:Uncharacterized protein n=1 Tax=Cymbomonas tetramitiformis TaxID=36881 RepID=A0AAE0CC05_9CHLO|nr:hypothetical protein CYMTET_39315 [Cymbomonas tetramitiformis]